ncbi:MAG: hypothetical protein KatS3mg105_0169 [Gemmatales bacterium]|nr:MAG: hypothetical protein KatS3mg105_0169 [Gemmatales bacterium]
MKNLICLFTLAGTLGIAGCGSSDSTTPQSPHWTEVVLQIKGFKKSKSGAV